MNSRHVKRIASPQANWGQREAYFALAMQRRLWRGLRSFLGRPMGASRRGRAKRRCSRAYAGARGSAVGFVAV